MKPWFWLVVFVLFLIIAGVMSRMGNVQKKDKALAPSPIASPLVPGTPTPSTVKNDAPKVSVFATQMKSLEKNLRLKVLQAH